MRVEVVDIRKHYGSVKANDGVSLTLEPGEIHGILGENGAGKSTLMKVLSGFTTMTSGLIFFNSRQTAYTNTAKPPVLGSGCCTRIHSISPTFRCWTISCWATPGGCACTGN